MANKQDKKKKPTLYLAGRHKGGPTPGDVFALVKALTGQEPSDAKKAEIVAEWTAKGRPLD